MKTKIAAIVLGLTIAATGIGIGGTVNAAPIECSGNQVATKTADFWACVNQGDNANESGDSNNPNGNPNFRR
jgi:hypothetical protein